MPLSLPKKRQYNHGTESPTYGQKGENMNKIKLNLQLFGEEVASEAAGVPATGEPAQQNAEQAQTGVTAAASARRGRNKENPLANVRYGRQAMEEQAAAAQTQDAGEAQQEETFEQLINGRFKQDFHNRVQGIVQQRFAKHAETQQMMDAAMPMLLALGQRYGVNMDTVNEESLKALAEKVNGDDSHVRKRAMELGVSEDVVRHMEDVERREKIVAEHERRSQAEQQFQMHMQKLWQQAETMQQKYPGFDLREELNNPEFMRMTGPGVNMPVEQAFKLIHMDELMQGGMQFAAQKGAERVAQAVQSGQKRIAENGMTRKGANVIYKSDPRTMNKLDRDEINRRAARGEKISF